MAMASAYKEIIDCLKELVETQNFVVIPDFGALVMQVESAEFSATQNVLFPPRKKIFFNSLLTHNDGCLIAELQKRLGIETVLAQTMVNQFVQGLKVLLDTKRRADLEGIGFFYKDTEDTVLFESVLNPFYLSESFGLSPISPISVEEETSVVQEKVISESKVLALRRKSIYKAAVVLILVSALFFYWWIWPMDIKNNFASIIGTKASQSIRIEHTLYPIIKIRYDDFFTLKIKKETDHSPKEVLGMDPKTAESPTAVRVPIYSIVAGCFKIEQNAQKLKHHFRLKGLQASIKWNSEKELFVVAVGNFSDKNTAMSALQKLKSKGVLKEGWIKSE